MEHETDTHNATFNNIHYSKIQFIQHNPSVLQSYWTQNICILPYYTAVANKIIYYYTI